MKSNPQVKISIGIVLGLTLALLAFINWDIAKREAWLAKGKIVRLELAPVDPRSLMQGDYMILNYRILADIRAAAEGENLNAYVRVKLNEQRIGSFVALESIYQRPDAASDETLLQVRIRSHQVKLATNGYFFQEGHGERYEAAKYGEFRVNQKGELLLDRLLDEELTPL
ncbi:GDYXXLXY domain-containing protein [Motilimonas eburnea]|uniref:GDYXXLXY domain-containing protein n=1 Tax=Motilimonas eburnea TaxID=1737488 RepID=UPI001E4268DF|nr:GDYXXLXY domain-containing protein [Motilimonas eburnea]MCE2572832.1 GDYXXLXY domain-containing protein [Motilimonas eburnea]